MEICTFEVKREFLILIVFMLNPDLINLYVAWVFGKLIETYFACFFFLILFMPEKFLLASCLQFAKTKTINQKKNTEI